MSGKPHYFLAKRKSQGISDDRLTVLAVRRGVLIN